MRCFFSQDSQCGFVYRTVIDLGKKGSHEMIKNTKVYGMGVLVLLSTAVCSCVGGHQVSPAVSPYEHKLSEVDPKRALTVIPGKRPIIYTGYFDREREIYGYNPRFLPNRVSFGPANRPYIVVGVHNTPGSRGVSTATVWPKVAWVEQAYLQTLNDDGRWVVFSLPKIIRAKYPEWRGKIRAGICACQDVYVDSRNEVYLLLETSDVGLLLIHGRNRLKTWDVHEWPTGTTGALELPTTHTFANWSPVAITIKNSRNLSILKLKRLPDGSLRILKPRIVMRSDKAVMGNLWLGGPTGHSGLTNTMVKIGDKSHIVFATSNQNPQIPSKQATPHYAVTYDHRTGKTTEPVLLGGSDSMHNCSDGHNVPGIVADSKGYLHVVLGPHQMPMVYLKSIKPNSTAEWTKVVLFNSPDPRGYETYPAIVIDRNDVLYCISRRVFGPSLKPRLYMYDRANNSQMALHLMRKRPQDDSWKDMGDLVLPYNRGYCIYYHRLTIDRLGRLFLAYTHFTNLSSPKAKEIYSRQWPDDVWAARDPVVLMSDNGGATWRLALTDDFVEGMNKTGQ